MSDIIYNSESVKLYFTNNNHRGPGKVVKNLVNGLQKVGIGAYTAQDSNNAKYNGWLQDCYREKLIENYKNNNTRLLGPNLFVLPNENPTLCKLSEDFVVPSKWVKDKYCSFDEMKDKNIHIWSVGIDTSKWSPIKPRPPWEELDCFIYFKNRSEQDLAVVEALCRKFNLKYKILKYGSYNEDQLYTMCQKIHAKNGFAILLTGTESQGIAYMQMLSFDIPCYVFNNPFWVSEDKKYKFSATSVPYFDERCGEIANDISIKHFESFIINVSNNLYSPREYILENHTLEKSAINYFNILKTTIEE